MSPEHLMWTDTLKQHCCECPTYQDGHHVIMLLVPIRSGFEVETANEPSESVPGIDAGLLRSVDECCCRKLTCCGWG